MGTKQTCPNGHSYIANGDLTSCPICKKEHEQTTSFLDVFALPARRALENAGITTTEKLSYWSEKEILAFHGIGKTSLPALREALNKAGLKFRDDLK